MPCRHITLPGGASAIVCSREAPRKRCHYCSRKSDILCDFPVTTNKSGTCDRPCCRAHSQAQGTPDTDYCLTHAEHARKLKQPADPAEFEIE